MVFFCCSVCGDSLKKNQVQKHFQKCRMDMVSCLDCNQEFWDDDYEKHIKCISEEEKYSGKDYKPRPSQNKGEIKQDAWLQQVQTAIDKSNPSNKIKNVLERLKDYPNIPRKKAKFVNFIRNSLRLSDPELANSVWDILMSGVPPPPAEEVKSKEEMNGKENGETSKEHSEKRIEEEEEEKSQEKCLEKEEKKLSKREKKEERRMGQSKMEKKDKKQKDLVVKENKEKIAENEEQESKKKGKKKRKLNNGYSREEGEENGLKNLKKSKKKKKPETIFDEDDGLPPLEPNPNHIDPSNDEDLEIEQDFITSKTKKQSQKKFDWEKTILTLLQKSKEKEMSVKKLRKKVVFEFIAQGYHYDSVNLLNAKFDRKVKKSQQFAQKKEQIVLIGQ